MNPTPALSADDAIARLKRPNVGWIDGGKWAPLILDALAQKDAELAALRAALYELSPLHPLVFVLGEEVEVRR